MSQPNKTIRQQIENIFGLPIGKTRINLYMENLNRSGKITQRSILDLLVAVCEYLDEHEATTSE